MVFSSISFLFLFLPVTIAAYYLAPRRLRNVVLVVASLGFYTWGAGTYLLVFVASIAANYVLGTNIERRMAVGSRRRALLMLWLGVVLNVGLLAWFKYAGFASAEIAGIAALLGSRGLPVLQILLPIGISFYTFHSLSYLIDIYRGTARHLPNPIDFALYISFFPQLIAGPIVRFHEIRDQLLGRSESSARFARGIYRFALGLTKKVVIADTIAPVVNTIFVTPPSQLNTAGAALGMVAYAVQLYFDFSGYTDMALGMGAMFGFVLPENFDRPYASRSITEFWRRWHMSLSRWFRDYLYIPLGGNRGSRLKTYRNLIVVFLLVGLWHGAAVVFIAWGAYHGLLLLAERALGIGRGEPPPGRHLLAQARTICLVLLGWILFRSPSGSYALGFAAALVRPGLSLPLPVVYQLSPVAMLAIVVGAASVALPANWVTGVRLQWDPSRLAGALRFGTVALALPVALMMVVAGQFSPFLYFQF